MQALRMYHLCVGLQTSKMQWQKRDYDELKSFWWMDIYAYGRYPKKLRWAYLKKKGYAPEILDEDMEILKKAAGEITFMGVKLLSELCV